MMFETAKRKKIKTGVSLQEQGLVKLIELVKIALLLLPITSKLFQFMILNLSGWFYIRVSNNFSKRFTNKGEIMTFCS